MDAVIYLAGHTLARLADPILLILAAIVAMRLQSGFMLVLAACGASLVTPLIMILIDGPISINPLIYILAGFLAALFWFSVFYQIGVYRRKRRTQPEDI